MSFDKLSNKLEYSPQLPINQESVQIFTEFIINLDYSFWNFSDFGGISIVYNEYD